MDTQKKIHRVIDANLNRAKEAFRVIEDICRFILDEKILTQKIKNLRHRLQNIANSSFVKDKLIKCRNIVADVGKASIINELKRKDIGDIFFANIERLKESVRVLEEFLKLTNKQKALKFKQIRYKIYQIEKEMFSKIR